MYYTKPILLIFIIVATHSFQLKGQNTPSVRWEPRLSLSHKINNRWSYNAAIRFRQRFNDYKESEASFKMDRWDIIGFGTYSFFGSRKLSLGYMYRRSNPLEEEKGFEHRFTQQFAFLTDLNGYSLVNKFQIEERILNANYLTRLRYAISTDFPLQGESLDAGEYYLIAGNELLYAFNSKGDELENRFLVGAGKLLRNGQKFELSLVSRNSDLISSARDHILQIESVYYFSW